MVRFPHYIEYTPLPALPEGEEWAAAPGSPAVTLPCRVQPQTNRSTIESEDGLSVAFSAVIYLDRDIPLPAFGSTVKVYSDKAKTDLVGVYTVKRPFKGQLNSRIWV